MRKMFNLLFALFIIYYGARIALGFLSKGHISEYSVNNYNVKEIFTSNNKLEDNNYYLEISDNGNVFTTKLYVNNVTKSNIVTGIEKLEGDKYTCLNISYTNNLKTDIICKDSSLLYNYSSIEGLDFKLDNLITGISYNITNYQGTANKTTYPFASAYYDNYANKNNVVLLTYNGYYYLSSKATSGIRKNKLYDKDIYKQNVNYIYKNYYITADYSNDNDFHKFNIINGKTGSLTKIEGTYDISYDSYFLGGVDNNVYILDCYNKKEYKVNISTKEITLYGTLRTNAKIYNNGKFEEINMQDVIDKKITFDMKEPIYSFNNINYDLVYTNGEDEIGYTVLYKKNGNNYMAYIVDNQNKKYVSYAFTTSSLDNIIYSDGNVYYVINDKVKVYTRSGGNKTIFESKELIENSNLHYGIYKN